MNDSEIINGLKVMKLNNSEFDKKFEKFDKGFSFMFKFVFGFIAFVFIAIMAIWGTAIYLAVTKGPETIQRAERVVDAYADKLEQESKDKKKSE